MADRPGVYYPPFREGWWYEGTTYAGHSDCSVDWNHRTKNGAWIEDRGDPVLAAADGTVAEVDRSDGLVMLNHFGGLGRTEYRHMQDITVSVGQKVRRGDRIGSIGNVQGSGSSTGPHLHHVHWRRDNTGEAFRRTQMAFMGRPVATSVCDSDSRPRTWRPPTPVMVQGVAKPPPAPAPDPDPDPRPTGRPRAIRPPIDGSVPPTARDVELAGEAVWTAAGDRGWTYWRRTSGGQWLPVGSILGKGRPTLGETINGARRANILHRAGRK